MRAAVEQTRYEGEPALTLRSGSLAVTVLPQLGLTGVSLEHEDGEFLAVPGGLDVMRDGRTTGFPLVAPWVNRLATPGYRVGDVAVDVAEAVAAGRVRTDGNGLPIHGFLCGRSQWTVTETWTDGDVAGLRAELDVADPAFPFPHRLGVVISARPGGLDIETDVTPLADRAVPFTFGWHPYLTIPGTPRERWRLRTPHWRHLALDATSIPTGSSTDEAAAEAPLGERTFDDLYEFLPAAGSPNASREFAFEGEDGRSFGVRCGEGYTHAQVWVPEGRDFASLEPMAAPTNALVAGTAPLVVPGTTRGASFSVDLTGPR